MCSRDALRWSQERCRISTVREELFFLDTLKVWFYGNGLLSHGDCHGKDCT